jgi:hypothetical protein
VPSIDAAPKAHSPQAPDCPQFARLLRTYRVVLNRGEAQPVAPPRTIAYQDAPGEIAALRESARLRLWLAGKHDVVPVAEDENLRRAPNDAFQLDHGAHAQSKLPQQQVLNEVER